MNKEYTNMDTAAHRGRVVPIDATNVLELFDRQIRDQPDAPAVVEGDRAVSYAELDRLADGAAERLSREHGIGRGDAVLIAAEAGIDFTVAFVGTMRAGAAYLPVDLSYPAERLARILSDSRAKLAVVAKAEAAPAGSEYVTLDYLAGEPATRRFSRPRLVGDDQVYLIFTSGSTGAPKGIIQTHRCLANFIAWQVADTGLGSRRRVLQAAPLSFDVSVQEMCYTLASGGCLYVPGSRIKNDPRDLMRYIIDCAIEVVDFPQSLIDAIMTLPVTFADAPALRHIISAGETVRVTEALDRLLRDRPELTMHNHYGPAENQMVAAHSMSAGEDNLEPRPPVGSLVWNTYVYVLDEEKKPVPDGEVGEVYIGGAGVGIGYTDPELTATVFIDDPVSPGNRVYRTRDRGRWRDDDTLELLGRIDDLIKIRGFSVEPREVEEHLARVEGVKGVAVYGSTRADGGVELHVALSGNPPPVQELRGELLARLPDYMVPMRWWTVDALPVSPNGKMDRKALPGPSARPLALTRRANQLKASP